MAATQSTNILPFQNRCVSLSYFIKRELFKLQQLVRQYFILRYRRSALGYMWSLLNPLVYMAVTACVFSLILRFPIKDFAVYLFGGMVPWLYINSAFTVGGKALIDNEHLLKKLNVPKYSLMMATSISLLLDSMIAFLALSLLVFFIKGHFGFAILVIPLSYLILFIFCIGALMIVSIAFCYFRDLEHLSSLAMQTFYYLTPIMYPISFIPEQYRTYFLWNPFYHFVLLFQKPIYESQIPSFIQWFVPSVIALITLGVGMIIYRAYSKKVVLVL